MFEKNQKNSTLNDAEHHAPDLSKLRMFGLAAAALGGSLVGCGPAKVDKWVDIKPNETGFIIPVEGENSQMKFESETALQERKVPAKRVYIQQRAVSTGRMPWEYDYIPSTLVIRVDRGLVTREWTNASNTGTEGKDQSLIVTTKSGSQIRFGINLTARIDEPHAARYLYFHGQRALSDVVDTNIRSDIQGILSRICGGMSTPEVQNSIPQIFAKLTPEVKELASARGITVDSIGPAEGIKFVNENIQTAIDQQAIAEASKRTAQQRQEASLIENKTQILAAQAQAEQAAILARNMESLQKKQQLEIGLKTAEAKLEMSKKWNGQLPTNIMPSNSTFLSNLGITEKDK